MDAPVAAAVAIRSHAVRFPALDRQIECREDESLFAAARRAGVRIVGACGGRGACGTCVVRVAQGSVDTVSQAGEPTRKWLRACCIQPRSELTLEVAPRSLAPVVRADVRTGADEALPLDAPVLQLSVQVAPASLQDVASDAERLQRALVQQHGIQPSGLEAAAIAELPTLLRGHAWEADVRIARDSGRVASVVPPGRPLLGLAVDLGTTNAAAFLVDLGTGRRLASLGLENPQVAWGADLISRINHAIKDPATARSLHSAAVDVINALAHDLARAVDARPADIADVVVCGNTAMQHLMAGWPLAQLGRAPFVAATSEAMEAPAREFGLKVDTGARLHIAPGIGGFVGGDHVTALLATEPLWSQPGTTLVMDIGTNTEISLVHEGRIFSASCPSGPALEGGHIASGMRAAEGAIERVAIDAHGALQLQVIGGGAPVGICGSGVLDALAAFRSAGWVDARGRILPGGPAVVEIDGQRAILLAAETADAPAVTFTQHDVRAVQLAKSAIRTGVRLLAGEAGIDESAIDRFVVAGAFGAYIDIASGVAIGLFPALPPARFSQIGNAAGLGVQQMLASRQQRHRAARLARECRYVELSLRPDFQKAFLHHVGFGH